MNKYNFNIGEHSKHQIKIDKVNKKINKINILINEVKSIDEKFYVGIEKEKAILKIENI